MSSSCPPLVGRPSEWRRGESLAEQREVVVRWSGQEGLSASLTAYHLRTEAEKGDVVAGVSGLPERYQAEILDPRAAFVDDVVLVALSGDAAVGCLVVTAPAGGRVEIKRLWTDPAFRGRGIAADLIRAALEHTEESGAHVVRLSVWEWRTGAIALYERFGFTVVESWDERDRLVCMERSLSFHVAPGDAGSPVILHVPHGSKALTDHARHRILLDDAALAVELEHMTDVHTDVIAARAAAGAVRTPWTFSNRLSRLVVDPERFPDDREEMRAVGMGAVYLRTSHGAPLRDDDPDHIEELLARHYRPYATAMTELVDARTQATGRAVILDVHSYPTHALPYELHATGNRPAVCLGVDAFHTPNWLYQAAREAFSPVGDLDVNTPFSGAYVPLEHYGRAENVTALMIEIRRDQDVDAIVHGLTALVDALSPL